MNANLREAFGPVTPSRLQLPEAAWARLRARLSTPGAEEEAWGASLLYGVGFDEVLDLLEWWRGGWEPPRRLLELPCFEARVGGIHLGFVHSRSRRAGATPLLLLHGFGGSLVELGALAPALNDAGYDVVSPALPGFGVADAPARGFVSSCAALMGALGYSRYAVHGGDLGAAVALELAAYDPAHVTALHLSHIPSYPESDPFDLISLTSAEKSRLARLTDLHEQLEYQLPETPVEDLAFALSRLDDAPLDELRLRDQLLTSLTLCCTLGDRSARAAFYQASYLRPAVPAHAPISVLELPLGAPTLRRFAEREHRIEHFQALERGGPSPALEQPRRLLQALTEWGERLPGAAPE